MKIVEIFVELIFWILIFLSPFLLISIVALLLYSCDWKIFAICIEAVGFFTGVLFAEHIRKKYGCSTFIGRVTGSSNSTEEESKDSEKN